MYVQDAYKTTMLITCINWDPPVPRFAVPTLQRTIRIHIGRTQARIPFLWVVALTATLLYLHVFARYQLYWTCAYGSQDSPVCSFCISGTLQPSTKFHPLNSSPHLLFWKDNKFLRQSAEIMWIAKARCATYILVWHTSRKSCDSIQILQFRAITVKCLAYMQCSEPTLVGSLRCFHLDDKQEFLCVLLD